MNSPYKEYYMNYQKYVDDIKDLEKKINQELASYKQKTGDKGSTIQLENQIKGLLKQYKDLQTNMSTAYSRKNVPGGMPEVTIDKRQKEIQGFEITYNEMEKNYRNVENEKYRFKNEITEDYSQKDEYKNMTAGELIMVQQNKLKQQDDQIEDIILDAKKGQQLAKNAGHVIEEQNKQIEQLNEDMDRNKENMDKLTGRFERYVAKFSMCKMIMILIIEIVIAAVCLIFIID